MLENICSKRGKLLSIPPYRNGYMPFKMEQFFALGVLLIIIGFLIVFFGMFFGAKEGASSTKVAIGGFIGPIPFGFGNDKNFVWFVTILSLVLFLLWLFFSFKFAK